MLNSRHAPPGKMNETSGMMMSPTRAVTSLETAAPITTATASAMAFVSTRNFLNCSSMRPPLFPLLGLALALLVGARGARVRLDVLEPALRVPHGVEFLAGGGAMCGAFH